MIIGVAAFHLHRRWARAEPGGAATLDAYRDELADHFEDRLKKLKAEPDFAPGDWTLRIDKRAVPLVRELVQSGRMKIVHGRWRDLETVVWDFDPVKGEHCTDIVHRNYSSMAATLPWHSHPDPFHGQVAFH